MDHCFNINFSLVQKITLNNVQNRGVLVKYLTSRLQYVFSHCRFVKSQQKTAMYLQPLAERKSMRRTLVCLSTIDAYCFNNLSLTYLAAFSHFI